MLLHGFGGSGASFQAVRAHADAGARYRLLSPDLRGHGAAAARRPVDLDAVLGDLVPVLEAAAARGPVVLGGYSLGGRIALALALARPHLVRGLLLVATTAGLADEQARSERRAADARLAALLREEGLEAFVARWQALALWDGDPEPARRAQAAELRAGTASGLAAALEGLSPGRLPALWTALPGLAQPIRVLSGTRDARYTAIADRLAEAIPRARAVRVPGAGHGLLREAPGAVAGALAELVEEVA